jgi:type IV secretory pathway VirB2 component (pilin)
MSFPLSLTDPPAASVVAAAASWIEALLLGSVGTTIAIVAVAAIGFMTLSGRLPIRRGLTVLAGCFVLFGATTVAAGLRASLGGAGYGGGEARAPAPPAPSPLENVAVIADPYAGASVPVR